MKAGSELLFSSLVSTLKLCTSPQLFVLEVEFGFSDKPNHFHAEVISVYLYWQHFYEAREFQRPTGP